MIVLITDMEMPIQCASCRLFSLMPFRGKNKDVCMAMYRLLENPYQRPDWCPLVEVPPHGRLIDADALKDVQQADADFFKGSSDYGEKCRYDEAINAVANIVNAPTIIPAEVE